MKKWNIYLTYAESSFSTEAMGRTSFWTLHWIWFRIVEIIDRRSEKLKRKNTCTTRATVSECWIQKNCNSIVVTVHTWCILRREWNPRTWHSQTNANHTSRAPFRIALACLTELWESFCSHPLGGCVFSGDREVLLVGCTLPGLHNLHRFVVDRF